MPEEIKADNVTISEQEVSNLFDDLLTDKVEPTADGKTDTQQSDIKKPEEPKTEQPKPEEPKIDQTKIFAQRLKEETAKVKSQTSDEIAKTLGFDSFAALQADQEKKKLQDKGFDPEVAKPIIDELVAQRLEKDERIQKLHEYEEKEKVNWANSQLETLKQLDPKIKSFDDVPKEVMTLWEKTGDLKKAYFAVEGESILTSRLAEFNKGTTTHLNTPTGGSGVSAELGRPLTPQERENYKYYNPKVTDEQLDKMRRK